MGAEAIGAAAGAATVHADLAYANRSGRNCLDIYLPAAPNPPLVVYLHGGGWREGSKLGLFGTGPIGLGAFLQAGLAVAGVGYRLSDEAIWPAQFDDLKDAFTFLRSQGSLGYDATRIAALGASAGGHLAAIAAFALAADPATRLAAAVVWFPPVDFLTMDADLAATGVPPETPPHIDAGSSASLLIGASVAERPDLARAASPLSFLDALPDRTPLPDILVLHGGRDALIGRGQSGRLLTALLARRPPPRLDFGLVAEAGHGGPDFDGRGTIERSVAFLARSLGGGT